MFVLVSELTWRSTVQEVPQLLGTILMVVVVLALYGMLLAGFVFATYYVLLPAVERLADRRRTPGPEPELAPDEDAK